MMRGFLLVSKIFLLFVAALYCTQATGQTSNLALKNLQRQKWQRAYELLNKAIAKDSLNVTAKYVLAQYFFSESNPAFHLDSAFRHALGALTDFQKASTKERDKLERFPVDSVALSDLRDRIDSAAFEQAKLSQTEESWIDFINRFPSTSYIAKAIEFRDSLAYEYCIAKNNYSCFHEFLDKYPEALQAGNARRKYEELLLLEKTADKSLESYETFLAEYPQSPHRLSVEQTIFEYRTAPGDYNCFVDFIRDYPQNPFVKKARNILFHLLPANEKSLHWPSELTTDSLTKVMELQRGYLVPFLKNKRYGFMDAEGNEIIPAVLDSIRSSDYCGNVDGDVIMLPDRLLSNTGGLLWKKRILNIEDVGLGFLLLEDEHCKFLLHKSGFKIGERCIDQAKSIAGKFIATQSEGQWSIFTLSGRLLTQGIEDVFAIQDIICIKKNNGVLLEQARALSDLPTTREHDISPRYDAARAGGRNLVLVNKQGQSALLDQSLNIVVPWSSEVLTSGFFGTIVSAEGGFRIYSTSQNSRTFNNIISHEPWLAAKDSLWRLIDPTTLEYLTSPYDTIIFHGIFPVGHRRDSTFIFFNPNKFWKGARPTGIEFVPGKVSAPYIVVDYNGRKSLFNHLGQKLLSTTYEKIQYAGNDLFMVQKNDKKGLMSAKGNLLVPAEYDGIGTINNTTFSLLKSTRFGIFDCVTRKHVPAMYTKNLIPYNHRVISAYRNGLYGFIGWDNKALSKFEFKEIQYWNDTTALVRKDNYWALYEIRSAKIVLDKIRDFKVISNVEGEKLAIIYQDANNGVIHSRRGLIIPIAFSDIVNVGSVEKPLYFTEKHLEEASTFVVIYYDDEGEILRKEVYDHEEYDKIYCHSN